MSGWKIVVRALTLFWNCRCKGIKVSRIDEGGEKKHVFKRGRQAYQEVRGTVKGEQ
jgi:hypothetical protein